MTRSSVKYAAVLSWLLLLGAFTGCGVTTQLNSSAGLNLVIKNLNSAYNNSNVYFTFRDSSVQGTINGQPLVEGHVYSLSQIGSGIELQSTGGRIYFSLGSPLPVSTADPEPVNPNINGYNIRFDKIELTYSVTNPDSVADLTSIDYFGIPLAIQTYSSGQSTPQQALTFKVPGNTVISNLAELAGNNPKVLLKTSGGNFLRVLGPTLAPAGSYPSFQNYITQVHTAPPAQIEDLFTENGSTPAKTTQCYNFTTSFESSGNLDLKGGGTSYKGGATVGPGHEIVIHAADLLTGIYSANPPYTVDGAAAEIGNNDVYAAVVRDVLAAFGFGFMGSETIDPKTGKAFSAEPSAHWWQSAQAFAFLQPSAKYYNQYAEYLYTVSSAYGQPFSDRWQKVQANLNSSISTMEIDVLPDTGSVPGMPVNVKPAPISIDCV